MATQEDGPVPISKKWAKNFLDTIAEDPFLAIVVNDHGQVKVFAKELAPEHIERIREVLTEIRDG